MPSRGLRLDELARELPGKVEIFGDPGERVAGVRHDSRTIDPGDLFVARAGQQVDGTQYISAAIERGARAIMIGRDSTQSLLGEGNRPSVPILVVDDSTDAMAFAAAALYGHPSFTLDVVGVTGTNGKTTVTHLVRRAIDGAFGRPSCGTIGTTGHAFANVNQAGAYTTPEADELARVMATMRSGGATHVAMEVSSHALELKRVRAVRFRVAAFTNLTQDHLDFHGTMERYAAAKRLLFTEYGPGSAVLNVDDPFGKSLVNDVRAPLIRVSARDSNAEIFAENVHLGARGIEATVRTPLGKWALRSPLIGAHNVENLLVALGIAHALDLELDRVVAALADEKGAPGRLERCDTADDDVVVLVDYAHTPDALERVLASVRGVATNRIICIFGCGGDRDPSKRAPMGEAVARTADLAIVTNDNPRTEDPNVIAHGVIEGIRRTNLPEIQPDGALAGHSGWFVELDRARAIETAVLAARRGDIVLIAGKGHEDYQIIGRDKRPFDDRMQAKRALQMRRAKAERQH